MDFSTKKENISYYTAIQLISLDNTLKLNNNDVTSREYELNKIFRSYSKKFYTPLHVVYTLPLHHILVSYFDDLFESMTPEDLEESRTELLKSEAQRKKEQENEEGREVDDMAILEQMSKEAEEATKKIEALAKAGIKPLINNREEPALGNPLLEPVKLMPDIKMSFITPEQMEAKLNNDSLGLLD